MEAKKVKVLLVEDNRTAQMAGKIVFTTIGCDVDIAGSGAEAMRLTSTQKYDIIFMDIGLGDTDGYAVTRKIRQQSTHNSQKPIIALTAHSYETVIESAMESGMNKVMTKPLLPDAAKKAIAEFIEFS